MQGANLPYTEELMQRKMPTVICMVWYPDEDNQMKLNKTFLFQRK